MTVKKHRCTNCKKYFDADTMIVVTAGKFHDQECLVNYGMKKTDKVIKSAKVAKGKANAKQKRAYYDKDVKTRKKAAKDACHLYIRTRDKGKPCPCCGKPLGDDYQAGHFIPSGQNPYIRYDEDNIHGQRLHCNFFKGGDSGDYESTLVSRIGQDRVDRLKSMKGGTMKRTCDDYREIEQYYKEKTKQLNIT